MVGGHPSATPLKGVPAATQDVPVKRHADPLPSAIRHIVGEPHDAVARDQPVEGAAFAALQAPLVYVR